MKKVYLETTIPSYLASRLSRDIVILSHQKTTLEWWEQKRTDYELGYKTPDICTPEELI